MKKHLDKTQQSLIADDAVTLVDNFNKLLADKGLNQFRLQTFTIAHTDDVRCCGPDETPKLVHNPDGSTSMSCVYC